ncbi:MAG: ABC transporter permease [Bacteroidota bacterium]
MIKKLANRLFRWFCHPDYYDDIRGDLEELYFEKCQTSSQWRADLYYLKEVLLLFRISLLRPSLFRLSFIHRDMIKNNLKTSLRYIWNQKSFSLIKIGGLSIGVAAFLILAVYLQDQWSYDHFYPAKDRLYRVTAKYQKEGFSGVSLPAPFAKTLVQDFPEVEQAGRYIASTWLSQVRPIDRVQNIYEEGIAYVDPELLEIWELPMVDGDGAASMKAPNTLIISKSKAMKFFSNRNPVGQSLIFNDNKEQPYKIVGVFEDLPSNSHIDVDFMLSLEGVEFWPGEQNYWGANMYTIYALVRAQTDIEVLNKKMSSLTTNYFLPSWIEREFVQPEEIAANISYELQNIQDIYLGDSRIRDKLKHGNKSLLWLFALSAILILVIAGINFINLSIARYSLRIKELTMRKILGASRKQLIHQLLIESLLYSFFAFCMGLLLAQITLPFFSQLVDQPLVFPTQIIWGILLFLAGILVLGLVTGIYPALFLSRLKVSAAKLKIGKTRANPFFQSVLVVFQFMVSGTLIICTIAILQQMKFILNKDIGYDKEQILVIKGTNGLADQLSVFKEKIRQLGAVTNLSVSDYLPMDGSRRYADSFWEKGTEKTIAGVNAQIWQVDPGYMPTLGIDLLNGRNFQADMASDSNAIILSQSMAQQLQIGEDLGELITNKEKTWKVIGVMDDFHFESFRNDLSPVCLVLGGGQSMMAIKLNTTDTQPIVQSIQTTWASLLPSHPFRFVFLEDSFAIMHDDVIRSGRLFYGFAMLAIFIACLGLFGLTAFNTDQRKKELGIRKVLGANARQILYLISKDFILLLLIANILAVPIGWYIANYWLANFAYRIEMHWVIFFAAMGLSFLMAIFAISAQCIRVALANPVESIRED